MRFPLFLAAFLATLAFAGPASARGTLDSILPGIRAEHPGRLSDAQPWTDSEGRTHYRIKWMTPEGRILYFDADADSGRYRSSNSGGDNNGGGWRDHSRGGDDSSSSDGGGRRSHWTGDTGGGETGDGDWRGRHDNRGSGDWGSGGRGDHGGGRGDSHSDWHGGQGGGGDNSGGGRHHHHGGD